MNPTVSNIIQATTLRHLIAVCAYFVLFSGCHSVVSVNQQKNKKDAKIAQVEPTPTAASTASPTPTTTPSPTVSTCPTVTAAPLKSTMFRDKGASQLLVSDELAMGALSASGYREVPDILKDDDGASTSTNVTYATRPATACGTTQDSITARIADCLAQNPATATWDGSAKGKAGEGIWNLVTYTGTYEVWYDQSTGLVWSDSIPPFIGGQGYWCPATGSSGAPWLSVDPSQTGAGQGNCTEAAFQDQVTPISYCAEESWTQTPASEDPKKGGMRLASTASSPSIMWRAPTEDDVAKAEVNGIRYVVPNQAANSWIAAIWDVSTGLLRRFAMKTDETTGGRGNWGKEGNALGRVRCVGRPLQTVSSCTTATDLLTSSMLRDKGTTMITVATEKSSTSLPAGYRRIPDTVKDDDGRGASTNVTYASRPGTICGTTQTTVAARIAHCLAQNPASATWNAEANSNANYSDWKLVTYTGAYEVWRDERTKLLWSDDLGTFNWCQASGSSGGGPFAQADPSAICTNAGNQNQVTPVSVCTENAGFNTSVALDPRKGGMKATATGSSPSVYWRLPTHADYVRAYADGYQFVMPNVGVNTQYWTATLSSATRANAFVANGTAGFLYFDARGNSNDVRCVGRSN